MRYTRVKDKNGEIHLAAFEKEETVFFLDELFPELKGKPLIDFVHMVNGDPQKAAQMICAADGSVHRMEEQEMLTPIEHTVHDILCVGVNYTDHLDGKFTTGCQRQPVCPDGYSPVTGQYF